MGELNRRVHVLLDDERMEWLRKRASSAGTSVGAVIRSAIDRDRAAADERRAAKRAAADSLLAAEPYPIGDPDEIKRELDELNERGFET
jgi:plasmid stability protein